MRLLLVLSVFLLVGCSSLQPVKNPDGSQTATPAGKVVLNAADSGEVVLEKAATLPGVPGLIASVLLLLTGYGVKRLHDKLDDITPETPVVTTIYSK